MLHLVIKNRAPVVDMFAIAGVEKRIIVSRPRPAMLGEFPLDPTLGRQGATFCRIEGVVFIWGQHRVERQLGTFGIIDCSFQKHSATRSDTICDNGFDVFHDFKKPYIDDDIKLAKIAESLLQVEGTNFETIDVLES
jgi:hypothetical protein